LIKGKTLVFIRITLGVLLVTFAFYFLYLPQNLVIGGVTGIATIVNKVFANFPTSIMIYILNAFLLIIGWLVIGKDFLLKTVYASILLPTIILILEITNIDFNFLFKIDSMYLKITDNPMSHTSQVLISVLLGGIMTGIGLGLCFKNNASTGGMDVIQKIIVKYFKFSYLKAIYITDGFVILVSFLVFGFEMTFYSLIAIFIVGIIIDRMNDTKGNIEGG